MEGANFVEWFHGVFLPSVEDIRHTGPVVLFLDSHQSHTTLCLVEEVRDRGIVFYTFPPHTTHLLQPLDVGVFGTLKPVWSKILKEFKLETMAAKINQCVFPSLVAKMWPLVLLLEHLIGGFKGAGLHPLSRDAIPTSNLRYPFHFRLLHRHNQLSCCNHSPSNHSLLTRLQCTYSSNYHPVSIYITQFVGNLFISQGTVAVSAGANGWTKPTHYGEALT